MVVLPSGTPRACVRVSSPHGGIVVGQGWWCAAFLRVRGPSWPGSDGASAHCPRTPRTQPLSWALPQRHKCDVLPEHRGCCPFFLPPFYFPGVFKKFHFFDKILIFEKIRAHMTTIINWLSNMANPNFVRIFRRKRKVLTRLWYHVIISSINIHIHIDLIDTIVKAYLFGAKGFSSKAYSFSWQCRIYNEPRENTLSWFTIQTE